jgi:hypothetical protein
MFPYMLVPELELSAINSKQWSKMRSNIHVLKQLVHEKIATSSLRDLTRENKAAYDLIMSHLSLILLNRHYCFAAIEK